MTVKQHTCFFVHCDQCGRDYGQDGITVHYDTADEVLSAAGDYDWEELSDGRVFCDDCTETALETGVLVFCEEDGPEHRHHHVHLAAVATEEPAATP